MKALLTLSALFLSLTLLAQSPLDEYRGTYKFPSGSVTPAVEISVQNGSLHAASSMGAAFLTQVAKDTFSIPDYNGMIYFFRNTEGAIRSLRVELGDLVLEGEKQLQEALARLRRKEGLGRAR
jgi:hypothetical protein